MNHPKVFYAEVLYNDRLYIYSSEGIQADLKVGKPHCANPNVEIEFLVSLDASHLYPVIADGEAGFR